jgi:hypothetical protein
MCSYVSMNKAYRMVILARRCMYMPKAVHKAYAHCDCCEAMHTCVECVFSIVEGICSQ